MKQRKGTTRRSAAQWAEEVRAWRRSGKTAAGYARRRGFKAATLSWWAWKLERDGILDRAAEVELVEVVATDVGAQPDAGWELVTAEGHRLRGSAAMSGELAEALVRAVVEGR